MAENTERIAILLQLEKEKFERNAKTAANSIAALERKFDPLAAAEAKAQKRLEQYSNALEAGTIDAKDYAKAQDLVQRELDQSIAKYKGAKSNVIAMNGSVAAQNGFLNRNKSFFQQAGYQVGDFAVQVGGGTSAVTAFAQQGSQLLGVLGPMGAIMGAVLAISAPLAGSFLRNAEDAATFDDSLKALKESIEALKEADTALQANFGADYGQLADEAEAVFAINRKIAELRATAALDRTARGIASEIGVAGVFGFSPDEVRDLEGTIEGVRSELNSLRAEQGTGTLGGFTSEVEQLEAKLDDLRTVSSNVEDLSDAFGMSADAAREVVTQFAQIGQAQGPQEQAEAMSRLMDYIYGASEGLAEADEEGQALYDSLREAVMEALNLAQVDMAKNIADAADEAARLAANLRLAEMRYEFSPGGQAMVKYGGRGTVSDQAVTDGAGNILKDGVFVDPNARSGGGRKKRSGGGGRTQTPLFQVAEDELKNIQRQLDMLGKTRGEVAGLTVKYKLLDEAKKRGLDITDELTAKIDAEANQVRQLAEEYEGAKDKIAAMEQIQKQFKDSVIDAAMGGKNAMDQFAKSIKRAAIEWALFGSGPFAGKKTGGGLLGGLFGGGGLLGGLLSFEGGGYTGAGPRSGGVDGRGGIPAIVHPNETVIDHTKSANSRSGQQSVHVTVGVTVDKNGTIAPFVADVSSRFVSAGMKAQQQRLGGNLSVYQERGTT